MLFRIAILAVLGCASLAAAQDTNNPEELKKMYQDALNQLKASQDRKNELAAENEKLVSRLAELEKQVAGLTAERAAFEERTWQLRSQYAAWQQFLSRYPRLLEQWKAFLSSSVLDPLNDLPRWDDLAAPQPRSAEAGPEASGFSSPPTPVLAPLPTPAAAPAN